MAGPRQHGSGKRKRLVAQTEGSEQRARLEGGKPGLLTAGPANKVGTGAGLSRPLANQGTGGRERVEGRGGISVPPGPARRGLGRVGEGHWSDPCAAGGTVSRLRSEPALDAPRTCSEVHWFLLLRVRGKDIREPLAHRRFFLPGD